MLDPYVNEEFCVRYFAKKCLNSVYIKMAKYEAIYSEVP